VHLELSKVDIVNFIELKVKNKKRELSSKDTHTHGPEQMFVRGCPGCEIKNGLIDLCPFI